MRRISHNFERLDGHRVVLFQNKSSLLPVRSDVGYNAMKTIRSPSAWPSLTLLYYESVSLHETKPVS